MIHHIVLWKLNDFTDDNDKQIAAEEIKKRLENLSTTIPEIKELRVGIDLGAIDGNFDVALHSVFADVADLEIYQQHPDHQAAGAFIKSVVAGRVCVDYHF